MSEDHREAGAPGSEPFAETEEPVEVWEERLAYLQKEEAENADPERGFQIQRGIREAQRKIQELRAVRPLVSPAPVPVPPPSRRPYAGALLLLLAALVAATFLLARRPTLLQVNVFVVDPNDRPVSGLEVWATLAEGGRTEATEEEQYYVLRLPVGDSATICARGDGYTEACRDEVIDTAMGRVEIELRGTGP